MKQSSRAFNTVLKQLFCIITFFKTPTQLAVVLSKSAKKTLKKRCEVISALTKRHQNVVNGSCSNVSIANFEHFASFSRVSIVDFESGKLMIYLFQFGL